MPSFKSINGVWEPATERVAIVKDGQPTIYEGPDREAVAFIAKEGGIVGQDASKDPQLIQASRNAGFNTVEEYLKQFAPTPKQVEDKIKADAQVVTHQDPPKKPGVASLTKGGFNDDTETPLEVMSKKK